MVLESILWRDKEEAWKRTRTRERKKRGWKKKREMCQVVAPNTGFLSKICFISKNDMTNLF